MSTEKPINMTWTPEHDILLAREIILINPFNARKGSAERGSLWGDVAQHLNAIPQPKFLVDKRSVRDHYFLTEKKYKRKMREQEIASGHVDVPTEIDEAIAEIIQMIQVAEEQQLEYDKTKNDKADKEILAAENMRLKAMEKCGDTVKRMASNDVSKSDKKRRSGNETIQYLKEKSEKEVHIREQELELKRKQQEIDMKTQEAKLQQAAAQTTVLHNLQAQQQQQQEQLQNLQAMLIQQQQQQAAAFMELIKTLHAPK